MMTRPGRDSQHRGRFVVLEGIDGSGTTTQAQRLFDALSERGHRVVLTREPTPGPVGALIRQALSKRLVVPSVEGPRPPNWKTLALLFAADRLDHNESLVLPALADGQLVISDRYTLSSLAYQSLTSESPNEALAWLQELNRHAARPDLTLICNVDPEVAARRRAQRPGADEIFEVDELQVRLAEAYASAERLAPSEPIVHIDANESPARVASAVLRAVECLLCNATDE